MDFKDFDLDLQVVKNKEEQPLSQLSGMIASAVSSALTSSVMKGCGTDCVINDEVKRTEGKIRVIFSFIFM